MLRFSRPRADAVQKLLSMGQPAAIAIITYPIFARYEEANPRACLLHGPQVYTRVQFLLLSGEERVIKYGEDAGGRRFR